jgi:hypothetical protein
MIATTTTTQMTTMTATATATRTIEQLQAKDFIAWLRRQVRTYGRKFEVGDQQHCPVEVWLAELGYQVIFIAGGEIELEDGRKLTTDWTSASYYMYNEETNLMETKAGKWLDIMAYEAPEAFLITPAQEEVTDEIEKQEEPIRTVHITWTCAPKIRMTARVDMPEYGLKKDQVFYLVRASADDGTYYLLTWSCDEKQWQCPCKWSTERPLAHQCRHRRLVSADCKARKEARKQAAQRLHQAIDTFLAKERKEQATPHYGEGVQEIERRLARAGLMA